MEREGAGKKKIFFQSFNISKKEREGEKKKNKKKTGGKRKK